MKIAIICDKFVASIARMKEEQTFQGVRVANSRGANSSNDSYPEEI